MVRFLLGLYWDLIVENLTFISEYPILYWQSYFCFKDKNMLDKFSKEMKDYLKGSSNELKLLNFILKNRNKLDEDDLVNVLDWLYDQQYEKDVYLEQVFDNMSLAVDMEFDGKFYLPSNKYCDFNELKLKEIKTELKGFNKDNFKKFLLNEQIFNKEDLDYVYTLVKDICVEPKDNIDLFGVWFSKSDGPKIKSVLVPKISNDISMLINVHEFVHMAVVGNSEYLNGYDIYNEDIPRFYEGVYKLSNSYVKERINHTDISKKMLDEYKGEPFIEQIEKYKYYSKKI